MSYILCSHNTFSYLKPRKWYHYFTIPFARCQSKDIFQQYKEDIRCFDIRVRFTKNGKIKFCHGLFEGKLKLPVEKIYDYFDDNIYLDSYDYKSIDFINWLVKIFPLTEKIYFHLVLETNKEDLVQEKYFINFCKEFDFVIKKYGFKNIILLGGIRKFDWKLIATNIKSQELNFFQHISSYSKYKEAIKVRFYEKICPWLYAKRTNKQFKKNVNNGLYKNYKILSYDFIHF